MPEQDRREWKRVIHSEEATPEEHEIARARLEASDAATAALSATAAELAATEATQSLG
jgi:hypothetical protein